MAKRMLAPFPLDEYRNLTGVGERLFLSPRTVEIHIQHLMDKLAVGSRAEIAAWHARVVAGKPQA